MPIKIDNLWIHGNTVTVISTYIRTHALRCAGLGDPENIEMISYHTKMHNMVTQKQQSLHR